MTEQAVNYDDVKMYRLDPEREKELLHAAGECTFIWSNKSGHPIGVTTAYVPAKGKIWMTATRERVRIKAIARDGRSSPSCRRSRAWRSSRSATRPRRGSRPRWPGTRG